MVEELIKKYVNSSNWAESTRITAEAKLFKMARLGMEPQHLYQYFAKQKYSRYTIKTYFIIASKFESRIKKNFGFRSFLTSNKHLFANAYREKQERLASADYRKMLEIAKSVSPGLYNAVLLMGSGGLRFSEALQVCWSDFLNDHELSLVGKGNKQRRVYIDRNFLLPTGSETIAGNITTKIVRRFFKQFRPFTPHSLRAFFITEGLERKGLNLKQMQKLVGHVSIQTTQRYWRADMEDAKLKLIGGEGNRDESGSSR